MADTVAFILPAIFRKYSAHKLLAEDFRWIAALPLPRDSFWTDRRGRYSVNAEFQVWTRLPCRHQNRRLFSPPPVAHRDFVLRQYNNTRAMLKVFAEDFDFAVPCQGWQDYSRRETDAARCEKKQAVDAAKTRRKPRPQASLPRHQLRRAGAKKRHRRPRLSQGRPGFGIFAPL